MLFYYICFLTMYLFLLYKYIKRFLNFLNDLNKKYYIFSGYQIIKINIKFLMICCIFFKILEKFQKKTIINFFKNLLLFFYFFYFFDFFFCFVKNIFYKAKEKMFFLDFFFFNYIFILYYLIFISLIAIVILWISYLNKEKIVDAEKVSQYECGFQPFYLLQTKFEIHFYLVAILFIIFDLEIALIVPWAINILLSSFFQFIIVLLFIIILTIGFIYEWVKGALKW